MAAAATAAAAAAAAAMTPMNKDTFHAALAREMERIARNADNWVERLHALEELRRAFERLPPQDADVATIVGPETWRLLKPLKPMIQDLRSQIVKEVCGLLSTMAATTRDALGPFLRELVPTLVEVRGSGNKVCGAYCAECLESLIHHTVIRGPALRFFTEMLLESKNKLIRLCCITALKLVVVNWSPMLDRADVQQLERGLHGALQDPSATCRSQSYELFSAFQLKFPKRAAMLMATVDYKIQRRLEAMIAGGGVGGGADAASVSSRYSISSVDIPTGIAASRRRTPGAAGSTTTSVDGGDDNAGAGLNYDIGDRVCIPDKELFGFVRFIGDIEGVKGTWIGIELDEAYGKNDGSVKGRYYFRCKPKHGVFARPHQVFLTIAGSKLLEQQEKEKRLQSMDNASFRTNDDLSDDAVEAALNVELSSLQLSPDGLAEVGELGSMENHEPTALNTVLSRASIAHRKYLDRLLQLVRAELEEHQRFETYGATASSADAVQYLQQLQNLAQDKIVLSDVFIQHIIQAQQAARES